MKLSEEEKKELQERNQRASLLYERILGRLSQEEAARQTGLSASMLSRCFSGQRNFSPVIMGRIEKLYQELFYLE